MDSPLSPVIANFFMEDFEKKAIEQATHKLVLWYRYVDDTFVIWPHGQEKLLEFLNHLNGLHVHHGNRKRWPPTFLGHRHIQENQPLSGSQSISKPHPY
jgi:hypothetical protein